MTALSVWWQELETGLLSERSNGDMSFQYHSTWLNHPEARPLSRSLPLREGPQPDHAVRAFFSGLLPEERIRRQVAANLGVSESNDFALLAAIGGECAGALSLLPTDAPIPKKKKSSLLSEAELARHLDTLPRRPLLAGEQGIRLSLAGAQSKLPIRKTAQGWFLSSFQFPSTHILKPQPQEYPGLVEVELFCLKLAKTVGIPTVQADILNLNGQKVLCVERYDREMDDQGEIRRIHQEDLCQSLGLPPFRKYQQEGGPSALDALSCIREWSSAPVLDIRHFLDLLIFNVLVGNADAHGKNFSWLYREDSRRLAPAYDLVATTLWPELSTRMAMRIGQAKYTEEATLYHFQDFARKAKLGQPLLKKRIQEMADQVLTLLNSPFPEKVHLPEPMQTNLQTGIRRRAGKMLAAGK